MKIIILFLTKSGSTREYAEYLHQNILGSNIADISEFDTKQLLDYDKVIIGSPTFAGNIQAIPFLIKNWAELQTKQIYFFSVGLMPPESEASKSSYEKIPAEIREHIQYVKLPGRAKMQSLNFFERFLMRANGISDKNELDMHKLKSILDFAA